MERGRSKEREHRGDRGAFDFVPSRNYAKKESIPQDVEPHTLTLIE